MSKTRSKKSLIGVVIAALLAILYFVPNVGGPNWWPVKQKLNYGLDIQGGLHLVMGLDIQGALNDALIRDQRGLELELKREGIDVDSVGKETHLNRLVFNFKSPEALEKAATHMKTFWPTQYLLLEQTETTLTYQYLDSYVLDFKSKVVQQSIETIRNRIDEFGVAEPTIVAQGEDRILVQLPGMEDANSAKNLIQAAAKLDFMLVEETTLDLMALVQEAEKAGNYSLKTLKYSEYIKKLNEDLKSKLPEKTQLYFQKSDNALSMEAGRLPFLLRTDSGLDGSDLDDARVSFSQFGAPEVNLRFNAAGTVKFKELTGKNVGRNLAIVLDKVVKTAPNLRVEIPNGQAVIELGSSGDRQELMNEAKMIATSLRAGSLPATLEQLEERRIGPSLGAESLKQAEVAALVGTLIIILLMIIRYKHLGVIASGALVLNLGLILTVLSSMKATLTLPGVAGMALTLGVAVDANVLIFERIREELNKGVGFALAIKEGYSRAMSAILDANVVVASTSLILLYFGTGPVRGFAVTLLIGILTTLFSQVYVTRVIIEFILSGQKQSTLKV